MDKKRNKSCHVTKSTVKKCSKQQSKISSFFGKAGEKDVVGAKSTLENSSNLKKRKTAFDSEENISRHESKLRKTVMDNIRKNDDKIVAKQILNGKLNKTDLEAEKICQKSIDDLFTDIDFSFESSFSVETLKKSNTKKNCNGAIEFCEQNKKLEKSPTKMKSFNQEKDECSGKSSKVVANLLQAIENEAHENFEMNDFFDDDWCGNEIVEADLSTYKRCEVLDLEYYSNETLVTVKNLDSEGQATVCCQQFWRDIKLKIGQICTIKAKKDSGKWIIDNNNGILVNDPDKLLAGTTIVGGLFCIRRSVLQDIFNGLQTLPHYEPDALTLTTGTISHEVLQEALQNKVYTAAGIKDIYNKKMKSARILNILYTNNLTVAECNKHTQPYLNHIYSFMQMYIHGRSVANTKKLDCKIEDVQDIEENIWLPKLGLKGKIDITAEVNIHSRRKVMPIEVKTGKPSFSIEHKGQVMLYILMMKMTGRDVDSGLLLYLKDNIMQEIKGSHQEIRDLILLRNNLTHYFSNTLESIETEDEGQSIYNLKFPEPINHPACERCPFNTLCCVYLNKDESIKLSDSHHLKQMNDQILGHLTSDHIDYVLKWVVLLQLEESAETSNFPQSDVWTLPPETREKRGRCISGLKIIGKVMEKDEKYTHVFTRQNNEDGVDINLFEFSEDEYVIVSTNDRVNISSGRIFAIESNTVTVNMNKNISELFPNEVYHIDKYGSSSLIAFNNYGNVGGLLDKNDNCARLRSIVIDKTPATFLTKVPSSVSSVASQFITSLNEHQQNAVMKVLLANDYLLIKGMPGTGKTQTLTVLIELLAKLGKSVLVTAHTNTAVDNILLRLFKRNVDFLRLGSSEKIHPTLKSKSEARVIANCSTPESIHAAYCSKNIVGVTCYSSSHPLLAKRSFDVCIVDESTQVLQPTVLRPLYSASKFVLVGDPEQLPPICRNKTARKMGLNESLFQRLDRDSNTVSLKLQYRMNSRIMDVANKLTYENELLAANKKISNATMEVKHPMIFATFEPWVKDVFSQKLEDSAIIINTTPTWLMDIELYNESFAKIKELMCNAWEAAIIVRLIDRLLQLGISSNEIGVISPYRAQVACLRKNIHQGVEINTVDQYQGRDKEVIIYSCTKSMKPTNSIKEFDLLQDHSRLTVAVTRAKHKLIIIGDKLCLERFLPFKKLFQSVNEKHIITVKDGENGFEWKDLMKSIRS